MALPSDEPCVSDVRKHVRQLNTRGSSESLNFDALGTLSRNTSVRAPTFEKYLEKAGSGGQSATLPKNFNPLQPAKKGHASLADVYGTSGTLGSLGSSKPGKPNVRDIFASESKVNTGAVPPLRPSVIEKTVSLAAEPVTEVKRADDQKSQPTAGKSEIPTSVNLISPNWSRRSSKEQIGTTEKEDKKKEEEEASAAKEEINPVESKATTAAIIPVEAKTSEQIDNVEEVEEPIPEFIEPIAKMDIELPLPQFVSTDSTSLLDDLTSMFTGFGSGFSAYGSASTKPTVVETIKKDVEIAKPVKEVEQAPATPITPIQSSPRRPSVTLDVPRAIISRSISPNRKTDRVAILSNISSAKKEDSLQSLPDVQVKSAPEIKPTTIAPSLPPRTNKPKVADLISHVSGSNNIEIRSSVTLARRPVPLAPSPAAMKMNAAKNAEVISGILANAAGITPTLPPRTKRVSRPSASSLFAQEATKIEEPAKPLVERSVVESDVNVAKADAYAKALSSLISSSKSIDEPKPVAEPVKVSRAAVVVEPTVLNNDSSALKKGTSAPTISLSKNSQTNLDSPTRALKSALKRSKSLHTEPSWSPLKAFSQADKSGPSTANGSQRESKSVRFGYAWKDELEQRKTIEDEDDEDDFSDDGSAFSEDDRSSIYQRVEPTKQTSFATSTSSMNSAKSAGVGFLFSQVICLSNLPFSAAPNCPCFVEVLLVQGGQVIADHDVVLAPGSNQLDIGFNATIQLQADEPLVIKFTFNDLILANATGKNSTSRGKKYSTLSKVGGMISRRKSIASVFGSNGTLDNNSNSNSKRASNYGTISGSMSGLPAEMPSIMTIVGEAVLAFDGTLGDIIHMNPTTTDSFISDHKIVFQDAAVLQMATGTNLGSTIMTFETSFMPFVPKFGLSPRMLPQNWEELQNVWGIVEWNKSFAVRGGMWQLGGDCPEWIYRTFTLKGSNLYFDSDNFDGTVTEEIISLRQVESVLQFNPARHCRKFSVGLESKRQSLVNLEKMESSEPVGTLKKRPFRNDKVLEAHMKQAEHPVPDAVLDKFGCDTTAFTLIYKDGREIAFRIDDRNYEVSERWRVRIMEGLPNYDPSIPIEMDAQDLAFVWVSCVKDVAGKPSIPAWWNKLEQYVDEQQQI